MVQMNAQMRYLVNVSDKKEQWIEVMVQRDAWLIASSGSKVAHLCLARACNFELKGSFSPQLKTVLQRRGGNVISQDGTKLFRIH
jgi:hypothetical protein